MENLIIYLATKYKIFIYGFITGAILQYFEIQAGNVKFNIGKFFIASCVFGVLAEMSKLIIESGIINAENANDSGIIVLSISLASFLYLFIPFVLKNENRGAFIESILNKFGFERKDKQKEFLDTDMFK